MESDNKAHANNLCGAKTRAGTPCKNKAMPNGRCRMHGGKSTGPKDKDKIKNNKNALTTGERESIIFDYLDDEEKELLTIIDLDKLKQIDNDIKLIDIRLRRMMGRIAKLQESELTIVSVTNSSGVMGKMEEVKQQNTLSQIQNIEDAITRVQGQKLRLIESKHKIEMELGIEETTEDDGFMEAMNDIAIEVWEDEES